MKFETERIFTKKRKEITLRMLEPNDAQALLATMVEIAMTSPYILTDADYFKNLNVEEEKKWIESYNEDPRSLLIAALYKGKLVGILDFKSYKNSKMRHRGILGISLHEDVRGEGLGQALFEKLLQESKKIEGLSQLELSVMGDNLEAYHLYKKVGFQEVARNLLAFKLDDGTFSDDILMVMKVKNAKK